MPSGKGHRFTAKEHRQAEEIIKSEEERGVPPKKAKEIGWATVNKRKSRGR